MDTPDASTLKHLYVDQQQSLAEIGRSYGVHKNQVRRWLIRAAIPARTVSEGTSIAQRRRELTPKHRAALVKNIEKARAARTEESVRKQAEALRGRPPHNKGKPWSPEERATHGTYRQSAEYRRKLSEAQKGEKGHNWQGGISNQDERLRGWQWRELRRRVYERDKWTCQECGVHCQNKVQSRTKATIRIQCHHIVPRRDGGIDDLDNLVTLCMSCHMKREWLERRKH